MSEQQRVDELEHENRLLQAEIDRLRVYKEYAFTDVLTEIPNRRFYFDRLMQEVARARRSGHALTVALIDLDHFREMNNRMGHRGGDQILKFFAQFLRANMRQEDVVCRIGGDEFALLLPDTNVGQAHTLIDRIRQKLGRLELSIDGRPRVSLSFSCGVASHQPDYVAEDLIEEADHSLFSAKSRGRNRVVIAAEARVPVLVAG